MRLITGIIGGLILAFLGGQIASIVLRIQASAIPFLLLWALGFVIAFKAKTVAKAWRWLLLVSALFAFMLPIAVRSIPSEINSTSPDNPAEAFGGAMGNMFGYALVQYYGSVCGVVMGVVFLAVGLVVGRDKSQVSKSDN